MPRMSIYITAKTHVRMHGRKPKNYKSWSAAVEALINAILDQEIEQPKPRISVRAATQDTTIP